MCSLGNHCWRFWHWKGVYMGNQRRNKLWSTVHSDTFLSEPALTLQVVCINQPWPPMSLSPFRHCSLLGPCLIDTDYYGPGTPHMSIWVLDILWPSCRTTTMWPLSNSLKSLRSPTFPTSNSSTFENKIFTCYLICDEESVSVMNFTFVVIMLCVIGVYTRFWQDCTSFNTLSHTIDHCFVWKKLFLALHQR